MDCDKSSCWARDDKSWHLKCLFFKKYDKKIVAAYLDIDSLIIPNILKLKSLRKNLKDG